jgi:hypothetical protein
MIVIAVSKTKRFRERIGSIIKEIATCRLFNLSCRRALLPAAAAASYRMIAVPSSSSACTADIM